MPGKLRRNMKLKHLATLIFAGGITILSTVVSSAQQTRSITSDDFASQRPAATAVVAAATTPAGKKPARRPAVKPKPPAKPKSFNYFLRKNAAAAFQRPAQKPARDGQSVKVTEIGVTMWKLRPPHAGESGYLLPVFDAGARKLWIAERTAIDTVFRAGDRVRFGIESSSSGYLYIFDCETYSDGTLGRASMIFPASLNDDNSVRPGILVDVPDQREDWPYLNINPQQSGHTGELLTVVVSPRPLTQLKLDSKNYVLNADALAEIATGSDVELFSRKDPQQEKIFTKAEAESTCGVKTRELQRENGKDTGCGITTRQLTRTEPLPQSILRVTGVAGRPAVALVRLSVLSN